MSEQEQLPAMLRSIGVEVDSAKLIRLQLFLDELLHWNRKINLTAITDRREAEEKHLVDALTLLPLLAEGERLLDMGSGAGIPGLVLKIVRDDLEVLSIDAVAKKINFQRHVIRKFGLQGAEALHARLEELGMSRERQGAFSVVVARAFADLASCAALARPFLQPGGRLIAMKGPEGEAEWLSSRTVFADLGYIPREIRNLRLPRSGAERRLLICEFAGGAEERR